MDQGTYPVFTAQARGRITGGRVAPKIGGAWPGPWFGKAAVGAGNPGREGLRGQARENISLPGVKCGIADGDYTIFRFKRNTPSD